MPAEVVDGRGWTRRAGALTRQRLPGRRGSILVLALATVASTFTARRLVQGRRTAERDAATISELYDRLDDAFVGQRTIAETLQRVVPG